MSNAGWPSVADWIGSSSTRSPIRSWAVAVVAGAPASEFAVIDICLLLASRSRLTLLRRS